jgi:F-type H+-transporting ATPase subunit delta
MAEKLTIARPYAQAVFEQALAERGLEEWEQLLHSCATIAEDPAAKALFDNPLVSGEQLRALFMHVTEKALAKLPAARAPEFKNFLTVLIKENRLAVLPEIFFRYQRLMAAQHELKEVIVTSAYPLDANRRESLTVSLANYLHSKVAVDFREDSSLIGGAIIRCGNWVMDGSIKGKLQRMRDNLIE